MAVTVPESYVGDVMGDLSKRRGRPMGMNPDSDGNTVVEAEVPMAEMSSYAIEGITSPDGRVLGKMGHSERIAPGLYKNVPGEYDIRLFRAAVKYFK